MILPNGEMNTFGERLKSERKKHYSTMAKFAEAMDVSVESVKKWEGGKVLPETKHLFMISTLLNCDIDYLTGRSDIVSRQAAASCEWTGLSPKAVSILHHWNASQKNALTSLNKLIECGMFFSSSVLLKIKDYFIYRTLSEGKPTENIDLFDIQSPEDEERYYKRVKEEKIIQEAGRLKELARFDLMNGISDCALMIYNRRK